MSNEIKTHYSSLITERSTLATKTRTSSDQLTLGALLGDFRLLLTLFIGFRLLLLLAYQPVYTQGVERGVSAGGDLFYYYLLGGFSRDGLLPFRDWWSEFPPIPHFLTVLIYQLTARAGYSGFAMLYGLLMLLFDLGSLIFVRRIGRWLHGANTGMALAWIYALMIAPTVFIWWNFEPMVAFMLLLSLASVISKRETRAALWAGVGALIKFTPALILGAVWRFYSPRRALRYTAIVAAVFGAVYLLLFAQNAAMTLPSLTAQFNKSSYQTVWALLDGNYRTGNFGTPQERLDPANANILTGNPSVVPGIVRLGIAAAVGLFVFARTRRFDDKGLVAFVTITLLVFFLQAQGWSPQWLVQIIPLVLLCFPTRDGVTAVVLLSAVTFAEYPFLWLRTGDTGGVISGELVTPFVILILARTAILIGLCVALYRRLRQEAVL
jgi:hypothetical protein